MVSVGDTIQGLKDASAEAEWQEAEQIIAPYRKIPLFLVPGNHDIWSEASEKLFVKYSRHATHYSFDVGPAHFTVLDNSRSEQFSSAELEFLEEDLKAHADQPFKGDRFPPAVLDFLTRCSAIPHFRCIGSQRSTE